MYKLLCNNLTKSHRSLTNFTGCYRTVAEKCDRISVGKKYTSETNLLGDENVEGSEEILDTEQPLKTKSYGSIFNQETSKSTLSVNDNIHLRYLHSKNKKDKPREQPPKKKFKNKEAQEYYQLAVQQCAMIKSKLDKFYQQASFTMKPPKLIAEIKREIDRTHAVRTPRELAEKTTTSKKQSPVRDTSTELQELNKINKIRYMKSYNQFKPSKIRITYPTHSIRYKLGTNKIQHTVKQQDESKEVVQKVYTPIPEALLAKRKQEVNLKKQQVKYSVEDQNIPIMAKLLKHQFEQEHSEKAKQQEKLIQAMIQHHPTVQRANNSVKMAFKISYNKLLKKSGLIYQPTNKTPEEYKSQNATTNETPEESNPKEVVPELNVMEHPVTNSSAGRATLSMKYAKRILSDKSDSYDIDATCIKDNNANVNTAETYGDYLVESEEKVKSFVEAYKQQLKDAIEAQAMLDTLTADTMDNYLQKLKSLRDKQASVLEKAKQKVEAAKKDEDKKVEEAVQKCEEQPKLNLKTDSNLKQYPITVPGKDKLNKPKLKEPRPKELRPKEPKQRSLSLSNMKSTKSPVRKRSATLLKLIKSDTATKRIKPKPQPPTETKPRAKPLRTLAKIMEQYKVPANDSQMSRAKANRLIRKKKREEDNTQKECSDVKPSATEDKEKHVSKNDLLVEIKKKLEAHKKFTEQLENLLPPLKDDSVDKGRDEAFKILEMNRDRLRKELEMQQKKIATVKDATALKENTGQALEKTSECSEKSHSNILERKCGKENLEVLEPGAAVPKTTKKSPKKQPAGVSASAVKEKSPDAVAIEARYMKVEVRKKEEESGNAQKSEHKNLLVETEALKKELVGLNEFKETNTQKVSEPGETQAKYAKKTKRMKNKLGENQLENLLQLKDASAKIIKIAQQNVLSPENRPTIRREIPPAPKSKDKPKKELPKSKPDIVLPPKGRNNPKIQNKPMENSFEKPRRDIIEEINMELRRNNPHKYELDQGGTTKRSKSLADLANEQKAKILKVIEEKWNEENSKTKSDTRLGVKNQTKILEEQLGISPPKIVTKTLDEQQQKKFSDLDKTEEQIPTIQKKDGPKVIIKLKLSQQSKTIKPISIEFKIPKDLHDKRLAAMPEEIKEELTDDAASPNQNDMDAFNKSKRTKIENDNCEIKPLEADVKKIIVRHSKSDPGYPGSNKDTNLNFARSKRRKIEEDVAPLYSHYKPKQKRAASESARRSRPAGKASALVGEEIVKKVQVKLDRLNTLVNEKIESKAKAKTLSPAKTAVDKKQNQNNSLDDDAAKTKAGIKDLIRAMKKADQELEKVLKAYEIFRNEKASPKPSADKQIAQAKDNSTGSGTYAVDAKKKQVKKHAPAKSNKSSKSNSSNMLKEVDAVLAGTETKTKKLSKATEKHANLLSASTHQATAKDSKDSKSDKSIKKKGKPVRNMYLLTSREETNKPKQEMQALKKREEKTGSRNRNKKEVEKFIPKKVEEKSKKRTNLLLANKQQHEVCEEKPSASKARQSVDEKPKNQNKARGKSLLRAANTDQSRPTGRKRKLDKDICNESDLANSTTGAESKKIAAKPKRNLLCSVTRNQSKYDKSSRVCKHDSDESAVKNDATSNKLTLHLSKDDGKDSKILVTNKLAQNLPSTTDNTDNKKSNVAPPVGECFEPTHKNLLHKMPPSDGKDTLGDEIEVNNLEDEAGKECNDKNGKEAPVVIPGKKINVNRLKNTSYTTTSKTIKKMKLEEKAAKSNKFEMSGTKCSGQSSRRQQIGKKREENRLSMTKRPKAMKLNSTNVKQRTMPINKKRVAKKEVNITMPPLSNLNKASASNVTTKPKALFTLSRSPFINTFIESDEKAKVITTIFFNTNVANTESCEGSETVTTDNLQPIKASVYSKTEKNNINECPLSNKRKQTMHTSSSGFGTKTEMIVRNRNNLPKCSSYEIQKNIYTIPEEKSKEDLLAVKRSLNYINDPQTKGAIEFMQGTKKNIDIKLLENQIIVLHLRKDVATAKCTETTKSANATEDVTKVLDTDRKDETPVQMEETIDEVVAANKNVAGSNTTNNNRLDNIMGRIENILSIVRNQNIVEEPTQGKTAEPARNESISPRTSDLVTDEVKPKVTPKLECKFKNKLFIKKSYGELLARQREKTFTINKKDDLPSAKNKKIVSNTTNINQKNSYARLAERRSNMDKGMKSSETKAPAKGTNSTNAYPEKTKSVSPKPHQEKIYRNQSRVSETKTKHIQTQSQTAIKTTQQIDNKLRSVTEPFLNNCDYTSKTRNKSRSGMPSPMKSNGVTRGTERSRTSSNERQRNIVANQSVKAVAVVPKQAPQTKRDDACSLATSSVVPIKSSSPGNSLVTQDALKTALQYYFPNDERFQNVSVEKTDESVTKPEQNTSVTLVPKPTVHVELQKVVADTTDTCKDKNNKSDAPVTIETQTENICLDVVSCEDTRSTKQTPTKAKIEEIFEKRNKADEKILKFNKKLLKPSQNHYSSVTCYKQNSEPSKTLLNSKPSEIEAQRKLCKFFVRLAPPYYQRTMEFPLLQIYDNYYKNVASYTGNKNDKVETVDDNTVYIEKTPPNRYKEAKTEEPPKEVSRSCDRLCLPLKQISHVAIKPSVEEMTTLNKETDKVLVAPPETLEDKYHGLNITHMNVRRSNRKRSEENFLPVVLLVKSKSEPNLYDKESVKKMTKRHVLEFRYELLRRLHKEFSDLYDQNNNRNVGRFEKVLKYYTSVTRNMKKQTEKSTAVTPPQKSIVELFGPSKPTFERVSRYYNIIIHQGNDKFEADETKLTRTEVLFEKLSKKSSEVDTKGVKTEEMLSKREEENDTDPENSGKPT